MAATSLGRLYVDLLMNTGSFETDTGRAARIADKRAKEIDRAFAKSMGNVKKNIIGVGVALIGINSAAAIAQKAFSGVIASIDNADKVNELSLRLGISAEKLSALGYAAQQSGSDLESIGAAIPKLSKKLNEASDSTSSAGRLFEALGIQVTDAAGNLRDVEDVLPEISDRFKSLTNDTQKQALAMELFGKSGAQMLEFLNLGSDGMKALEDRASSLGITISGETAAAADEFNDKLAELKSVGMGVTVQLMEGLLPQLSRLVDWAVIWTSDGRNASDTVQTLTTVFGFLADTATIVGDVFRLVGTYIAGAAAQAAGFYDVASGLISLDWGKISSGIGLAREGQKGQFNALVFGMDNQGESITRYGAKPSGMAAASQGMDFSRPAPSDGAGSGLDRRVSSFFSAPSGGRSGGGRPKPGKSEEQKKAEALVEAYKSLNASQLETIALFGKEGQAAQVRYDIEFGSLAGLDKAKADQLVVNAEKIDQLKVELELKTKLDGLAEQQAEKFEDALQSIEAETEALGMSNLELEIRNNLLSAGVMDAGSAQGIAIIDATKNLEGLRDVTEAMDGARSVAYDFLVDLPNSGKDAWKNALASIEAMLIQWAAKGLVDQLFGEQGTSGKGSAGGGWLGGLFSSLSGSGASSGGGGFGSFIGSLFGGGRASGGPVSGGQFYDFLERGEPEMVSVGNKHRLFMPPNMNGSVTPMGGGKSGGNVYVTQNLTSTVPYTRQSRSQLQQDAALKMRVASARNA